MPDEFFKIPKPKTSRPIGFLKESKKEKRALSTPGSKLAKLLDIINRPSNAVLSGMAAGLKGEDVMKAVSEGIRGKRRTEGSKVISILSGQEGRPLSKTDKIIQSVGGFSLAALTDPINALGIGAFTKAGQAARMAGTKVPFIKGLMSGERSLVSYGGKHLPGAINKPVGKALGIAGELISKIPGVKALKKGLVANKSISQFTQPMRRASIDLINKDQKTLERLSLLEGKALKSVGGDRAKMVSDVRHIQELPVLFRQKKLMREGRTGQRQLIGQLFEKARVKDPVQSAARHEAKRILRESWKESILLRPKSISPEIKEYAKELKTSDKDLASRMLESGVATKEELMSSGYSARNISKEQKEAILGAGQARQAGPFDVVTNLIHRPFGGFTAEQVEKLHSNPITYPAFFAGKFGSVPPEAQRGVVQTLKNAFGTGNKEAAKFYDDHPTLSWGQRMLNTNKAVSAADAVQGMASDKAFSASTLSEAVKNFGSKNIPFIKVDVPSQFQAKAGVKEMYMPTEVAEAFKQTMERITNPRLLNEFLELYDNGLGAWKQITLFGTPLVATPTVARDLMGNMFLSWMRDSISTTGMKSAGILTKLFLGRPKSMKAGTWASKLSGMEADLVTAQGKKVALKDIASFLDKRGAFNEGMMFDVRDYSDVKQLTGMGRKFLDSPMVTGVGQKMNETAEIFGRTQHFTTRVKQGWSFEAAFKDMMETQYDYLDGLTPFGREVGRRIMPFFSWLYFNIPAMIQQSIKHPAKLSRVQQAIGNVESTWGAGQPDERTLDEFIKGDLHARITQDEKGQWRYFRLKNWLPVADLEDITSVGRATDLFLSGLTPALKVPLETTFNKSLFFKTAGGERADIERYPGEQGEFLGLNLRRKDINIARNLRILGELQKYGVKVGKTPRTTPELRPIEKSAKLFGINLVPVDRERAVTNAIMAYSKKEAELKRGVERAQRLNQPTDLFAKQMEDLRQRSFTP